MDSNILKKLFYYANKSLINDEFPVSAIIYDENGIISYGYNKRNKSKKTTDHAEIIAIERANKKLGDWRLTNKCMVVTLEPCDMCKTVIKEARLKKVTFIVERLKTKRQNKCTVFCRLNELTDKDKQLVEKYIQCIENFFIDKR